MTERQSPPTHRVVQVLGLLGENPHRRLTLTQVAERLGLSKPTCLGILAALAEAEYVTRDASKAYGLGPALLRLGWAAETGIAALDLVRPHVRELHEVLGRPCILAAVHGDRIVVVDRQGRPALAGSRDLVGEHFPFVPPLGIANVAWRDDDSVRAWLARPPLVPIAAAEEETWALVRAARRSGYLVERRSGAAPTQNIILANLEVAGLPRPVLAELRRRMPPADWAEFATGLPGEPGEPVPVSGIAAPVYDRHGVQRYSLTVLATRSCVTVAECRVWAAALLAATAAAGRELGRV
ncbi:IclR family transcriptional regulator [Yinghuangia soli]|uniref:IclR family transcriptional regulator n=1 Tax=Yinghuangia soli TaxID=2908204 RepID=UPI0022860E1B|nr:helix-turn-helix domain-containing protein [Yinghuangia soli]